MNHNEWEKSMQNTLPEAEAEPEEQLRVILYCMDRLKVLIREETNEINRAQLKDLEQVMLLWVNKKAESKI